VGGGAKIKKSGAKTKKISRKKKGVKSLNLMALRRGRDGS